ncbi:MAG: aldehyde dehydrogenase family protein [Geminicoccaceae bacterium]|nr:aldehyde dehydrogenase family protein [Geminicoccaceae bacterium]
MTAPPNTHLARGSPVEHPLVIAGERRPGEGPPVLVLDRFLLEPWAIVRTAGPAQCEQALARAHAAVRAGAPSPFERGRILARAARLLEERAPAFVAAMQAEAGFTRADAEGEVRRAVQTLALSGEEARRLTGEMLPLEGAPGQEGRLGFTIRVPVGVVLAITPFNAPLNTVAHKIAPAFAAGNAVVLKPSSSTPVTALLLAELLLDAGLPPPFLSVLCLSGEAALGLVEDPRVRFVAFTGSTATGLAIQRRAGLKRTQMELGSIAFTILCADADLDAALPKIVNAAYRKAGQVCTSIQVLLVEEPILRTVEERLAERVRALAYGDPRAPGTVVGPLIAESEARRVESWIAEAVAQGARLLAGGGRRGPVVAPTLLADVRPEMRVMREEVFGPVLCLVPFAHLGEAIERVNATPYGLATGIFTDSLDRALVAARGLEVGAVHVNETSSSRVDLMPYGGCKASGFGREGPRYAIREMSEERVVTIAPSRRRRGDA